MANVTGSEIVVSMASSQSFTPLLSRIYRNYAAETSTVLASTAGECMKDNEKNREVKCNKQIWSKCRKYWV